MTEEEQHEAFTKGCELIDGVVDEHIPTLTDEPVGGKAVVVDGDDIENNVKLTNEIIKEVELQAQEMEEAEEQLKWFDQISKKN